MAICTFSLFSFSFVTDYFEISKNLDVFASAFREVNMYYVDETKPGDLMKTGIDAMLNSLDPYTNYIPESDIEDYRFMTTGQYGGIGATVGKHGDYVFITEPYENFPAFKADLRAGDKLVEIDGKSLKGKAVDDVSKLLKGQPGTELTILIEREGEKELLTKKLKREEIKINAVPYYGMLPNDIGYISLNQFTESASREVKDALEELKKNNLKGLVFDLRGNPGGLLNEAVNICNLFIDKGQEVVFTRGKAKEWDKSYRALNSPVDKDIPVTLIVNSGSASASEIVSGTFQDLDRGVIIGQRTYGKGLVQATRQLSYNSKLKVTTAKYYIPSGRCIQAINYSNRNEDGSVGKFPDSLSQVFKTQNGRIVRDGGGVDPDLKTDLRSFSKIARSISSKNYIFDYATRYRYINASIAPAAEFKLTDAEYDDFMNFISDKEYDYITRSEQLTKELKEIANEEKYLEVATLEYEALRNKIQHDKKSDLIKFKDEIKDLLEAEIVARYYYQKGRIQSNLAKDKDVKKAIEVMNDNSTYTAILKGNKKEVPLEKKN